MKVILLATLTCLALPLGIAIVAKLSEPKGPLKETRRDSHDSAIALAFASWTALSAIGMWVAAKVDYYPLVMSDKGQEIESAFRALTIMAAPVAALVVTILLYGIIRRGFSELPGDAAPIQGRGTVPFAWFGLSAGLTALVIVYPGLTSLHIVSGHEHDADVHIEVEGLQWTWLVSYPDQGLSNIREIVVPVDKKVTFDITSRDVLHSFWVPAFLMKVDAVPGLTTSMSLKPTFTGDFDMDPTIRLQCAELCGLSHANMSIPVRVVSQSDFELWVKRRQEAARAAASGEGVRLELVAKDLKFDTRELSVDVDRPTTVVLDNQDNGVSHNWALYENERAATRGQQPIAASATKAGPSKDFTSFTISKAGTFFFRCDVHPTTMTGTLLAR